MSMSQSEKKDEIKQLIIQMLLVNDKMARGSVLKFFGTVKYSQVIISIYELNCDNIICYTRDGNFLYLNDK